MNTFLPYPSFAESAACLDRLRLGKQRVEVMQILSTLLRHSKGWRNHPAVRMWQGHELTLADYGAAMCAEWMKRGYADTVLDKINLLVSDVAATGSRLWPPWIGDERVHSAMRASLLNKDYMYYRQYGWTELPFYGYRWDLCTEHLKRCDAADAASM